MCLVRRISDHSRVLAEFRVSFKSLFVAFLGTMNKNILFSQCTLYNRIYKLKALFTIVSVSLCAEYKMKKTRGGFDCDHLANTSEVPTRLIYLE